MHTHFKNIDQQVDLIHIQTIKSKNIKKGKKLSEFPFPNLNNPLIYKVQNTLTRQKEMKGPKSEYFVK